MVSEFTFKAALYIYLLSAQTTSHISTQLVVNHYRLIKDCYFSLMWLLASSPMTDSPELVQMYEKKKKLQIITEIMPLLSQS